MVFQILIPSKDLLIYYSILTHIDMHLTSKHDKCPTLIHSIKTLPFKIYPRAANISKAVKSIRHLIKHIKSFKHNVLISTKHIHHVHQPYHAHHPNQMHVHVIMHDLPHLTHCITVPMHQCMFMFILFIQDINPNYQYIN